MSMEIVVEHPVEHMFMLKNGLLELWIKRLKLVARPLLMRAILPMTTWRYVILHAIGLIHIKPTSYHNYSIMQLVFGQ